MALIKGTNSYATVAEADTYFTDRIDASNWTNATSEKKSQALITATALLDEMDWTGIAVSDSQTLAFPREGTYFDPKMGTEVILDENVPVRVITATFELALHLITNSNVLDDTGSVDSIVVGEISLTKIKSPNKIPSSIKRIVKPLILYNGLNIWWRAN